MLSRTDTTEGNSAGTRAAGAGTGKMKDKLKLQNQIQ
jgi:hypothetical protein